LKSVQRFFTSSFKLPPNVVDLLFVMHWLQGKVILNFSLISYLWRWYFYLIFFFRY
jgi:hypothetical protein